MLSRLLRRARPMSRYWQLTTGRALDQVSATFEAMGADLLAAEAAAVYRAGGRKTSLRAWSAHAHRRLEGCEEIADRLVVSGGEPNTPQSGDGIPSNRITRPIGS